jgi:hypothetical protein
MPITPKLRSWFVATALLVMAASNGVLLWKARVPRAEGYFDFTNFYTAGTLVRRGLGAELYDQSAQWKVQQEFASEVKTRHSALRYMRPPFEALFFSLFARWPYPRAFFYWTIFKLVLLGAIPFVVASSSAVSNSAVSHPARDCTGLWQEGFPLWLTAFLLLGTFPVFIDLLSGQDAVLLAFLFALCFRLLQRSRDLGAGLILGLALFKFQFALPFFIVLWIAGRKRVVPGFAISTAFVVVVSGVLVGWRGLLKYPGYLLALSQATDVGIKSENQMTLRGLLTLFVGRAPYPGRIHWLLAPVAVAGIVFAGLLWRRAGDRFLAEGFGLAAIIAIVTSYYAYDYDLLLLIVPLLAMRTRFVGAHQGDRVKEGRVNGDKAIQYLEAAGLVLLFLTPAYWFTRVQLHAECLMTIPLLAVGVAQARSLGQAPARLNT